MQFYKETEFKEVELNGRIVKIPKDWEVVRIRDIFDIKTGTTPSTKMPEYWENGTINWFTPVDLSKLNGKLYLDESERKITERALKETNLNLLPTGSIIVSTRAPVGYVAIITKEATFNQGCKGLVPKNDLSSEYYAYLLQLMRPELEQLSGGSTFKELKRSSLEEFQVLFPPLEEQKKIAHVLRTIDDAIEIVETAIKKLERIKKATMEQLLTKGIGHKEFKIVELDNPYKA